MFPASKESDDSKRETGQKFVRNLFPEAARSLDQSYARLDHLFRVIGGEIIERAEGSANNTHQASKYSFQHDGKIYQSAVFNAEQIKIFVTAKEFVDLIDMPDHGQASSIDMQTERVRLLISKLEQVLEEKRTLSAKRRNK